MKSTKDGTTMTATAIARSMSFEDPVSWAYDKPESWKLRYLQVEVGAKHWVHVLITIMMQWLNWGNSVDYRPYDHPASQSWTHPMIRSICFVSRAKPQTPHLPTSLESSFQTVSICSTSQTNDALPALRLEISYGWLAGYHPPHNTISHHTLSEQRLLP